MIEYVWKGGKLGCGWYVNKTYYHPGDKIPAALIESAPELKKWLKSGIVEKIGEEKPKHKFAPADKPEVTHEDG